MTKRTTAITGAAGEHYVAYLLSMNNFAVAMTRGGSQAVDLMVGDIAGNAAVSIQVKTASKARKNYKRKPEKSHWSWDVGPKARKLRGKAIFYALVAVKKDLSKPDVFIVPSEDVANRFQRDHKRYFFKIEDKDKDRYFEKLELIKQLFDKTDSKPTNR